MKKKNKISLPIWMLVALTAILVGFMFVTDCTSKKKSKLVTRNGIVSSYEPTQIVGYGNVTFFTLRGCTGKFSIASKSNMDMASSLSVRDSISFSFFDASGDSVLQYNESVQDFWNYTVAAYDSE